ncbi:MAG: patatin-like phospholipase family protein [Lachnospiraceae bacterium]
MGKLTGVRTGIALSGGGAKGAYQIGMFQALEEAGLEKQNLVLSGCSIGAMTALAYAAGDVDFLRRFFRELGKAFAALQSGAKIPDWDQYMQDFWASLIPDEKMEHLAVPVTVCCYCQETARPEYFLLNGRTPEEMRRLVTASGSLPGVLPAVSLWECRYTDGGVVPKGLEAPEPADKVPVKILRPYPMELEIVSYLTQTDTTPAQDFVPGAKKLEIWPSRPLEDRPHAGTLDFSEDKLLRNEAMGYADTTGLLASLT